MLVLTRGNEEGLKFDLSDGRSVTVHIRQKGRGHVCVIDAPLTVGVTRIGKLKDQGKKEWKTKNTNR